MAAEDTSKSREGARWFLPVVLLVLTVVVLALAAIVSLQRPGPAPDPAKPPERITAEVILAKARPLIEADKYAAGPLAKRALDQADKVRRPDRGSTDGGAPVGAEARSRRSVVAEGRAGASAWR